MNLTVSASFWQEEKIVVTGQFLKQALFGLSDFLFIVLEPSFHVAGPVNHHPPEQFGQLASQGQIGHQAAATALEPSKALSIKDRASRCR